MLLYDIVARGAARFPDRPAVIARDAPTTYGDLQEQTAQTARGLRHLGVGVGDRVAVLLPNGLEFTLCYYAAAALGAICVPANPLLKPAELVHIWGDSGARVAVTAVPMLEHAQEARCTLPELSALVCVGGGADLPCGVTAWEEMLAAGNGGALPRPDVPDTSPAVFIYTSGTTGRPKGAMLSHRNLLANCRQIQGVLRFGEADNLICVLPLFHSFAGTVCQNASLFAGARFTIVEFFHPARVLEAVEQHRVTVFPGVPAMFGALAQFPTDRPYDFSSVRLCVSGGAPMPAALLAAFEAKFGVPVLEGDGPTECSPVTSVNPPDGVHKPGSIGLPVPGVDMRIFDDADHEVPVGEVGEIVVRGENVMLGYHGQPAETAAAMRSGWYHTGDLGRVDEDGYFFIVDRKKDMLIVGGINVYPREIEEVLYAHPTVADAAVVGAPDPLRGEEVVAIVALRPGAQASARELVAYCRRRLANYKVPRRVIFRDALPRGATGKVLKRLLRKELELGG
ncbi:MAG: long-chain fatty acid--CoA ligase [Chthonomonadales bacterium]|nr:long-chain fatty acid--CoA ligase [Chthonomonadales bacterium]